jgi:YegS/Rv2252/BmrU family lipid kinase
LRTVLILNPKAGQGRHLAESRGVLKLLRSHRWDATLVEASTGHELAQAVRNAVMAGVELVVAAGGDGTISTVASMLAGGTAALGVIPSGTLNHFARDLGIPLSIPRAAEVLLQANIRRIDIGEVNGMRFINNSSLGLYPGIVRYREARRRTGWSRLMAFSAACLLAFRRYRFLNLDLEVDGTILRRRSPFLLVANNQYEVQGLRLGRREHLDTGKLAIYLTERVGRLGLLRVALAALFRRLRNGEDFAVQAAQRVTVKAHRKHIQVALDGEVARLRPPLRYVIRPGLLKVIAPKL